MEDPRPDLAPGSMVAERYRVVRELGRGAMGAVYEVEDGPGKRGALKSFFRISGGKDVGTERARFLREAAVSQSLVGEHIVSVRDHGFNPATGTPFMVMDLLVGEDLESAIGRVGPLDPKTAVAIAIQACKGLDIAHRAGVIHRDLKPSNLFLHRQDSTFTAKVCDFGIAKVLDQGSLTETGSVMGSPLYMPPEQLVDAKRVDVRSDMWSMAMTLYHSLAGVAAFHATRTFADLVVCVSQGRVPPLQDLAPWVPGELARVVHGALLVDRAQRCPSAMDFASALAAAVPAPTRVSVEMIAPMSNEIRAVAATRLDLATSWSAAVPTSTSLPSIEAEDDPLIGETLGGKYRLSSVLGRGGMGAVYRAETPDKTAVAIKVIRPDLDTRGREVLRRFVREAKASQGIESPHVAAILDAGGDEVRGIPFIVMELLTGRDLGGLLKEVGPIEPQAIVPVFVQACEGLAAAHARGIVHRDIKPANIFLHEKDGTIVAKVCDFGVAKQIALAEDATELTRTGGMLGSPMYMSPEQAQNAKNVDHRSDVWSLGVSLYEALTGQKPWDGSSMGELILAICTRELQPLRELAPWVEPDLARVVHKAVARNPDQRFQTAADFAQALRPFASRGRLETTSIRAIAPERRQHAAAARASSSRLLTSSLGGASTANEQNSAVSVADRAPRRSRAGVALVVAGVLAAAGVAGTLAFTRKGPPVQSAAVAPPPPAAIPPQKSKVRVTVFPRDARVSVNGGPVALDDGDVVLEGQPGDIFRVAADSTAGGHAETTVAISNDGRAVPDRIEVPAPTASAAPPSRVAGTGAPPPRASSSAARPQAAPAPSPSPAPSGPSLQTKWQ